LLNDGIFHVAAQLNHARWRAASVPCHRIFATM
jgi:hypothetical protein